MLTLECNNKYLLQEFERIKGIISSEDFKRIIRPFKMLYIDEFDGDIFEYIHYLKNCAVIWNYRGGKERFETNFSSNELFSTYSELKKNNLKKGLKKSFDNFDFINTPEIDYSKNYDYIFVLGGACRANFTRSRMLKDCINNMYEKTGKIPVIGALVGNRVIRVAEANAIDDEIKNSKSLEDNNYWNSCRDIFNKMSDPTETTVTVEALASNFGLNDFDVYDYNSANISDKTGKVYEFHDDIFDVFCVEAPSKQIDGKIYRAQTIDNFESMVDVLDIPEGANVLCITTQIYVPYQRTVASHAIVNRGINVDVVGTPMNSFEPQKFLQEFKAMIDAMYTFTSRYEDDLKRLTFNNKVMVKSNYSSYAA